MSPSKFISWLEGVLAVQDKETKLSKAIRAKLKQVSREEWVQPYFQREIGPVMPVKKTWGIDVPTCGFSATTFK